MNQTFEQLQQQVIHWADMRSLLPIENHTKQFMKVVEELGELSSSIIKSNREEEIDAFGDVLVTLIILARQRGVNLVEALDEAYNEIANRKGVTVNGVFLKKD